MIIGKSCNHKAALQAFPQSCVQDMSFLALKLPVKSLDTLALNRAMMSPKERTFGTDVLADKIRASMNNKYDYLEQTHDFSIKSKHFNHFAIKDFFF